MGFKSCRESQVVFQLNLGAHVQLGMCISQKKNKYTPLNERSSILFSWCWCLGVCGPMIFAYLSISLLKGKANISKENPKKAVKVKRAELAPPIQSWPSIRPLNFTIGGPRLLPCAKWFNLHSPSAAPGELDLGGRGGSARLPPEARARQTVSLHPVGQLYGNAHERPGTRSSGWDGQADTEQGRPSPCGAEGADLADYTFRNQMRLHQRGPPITGSHQMRREPNDLKKKNHKAKFLNHLGTKTLSLDLRAPLEIDGQEEALKLTVSSHKSQNQKRLNANRREIVVQHWRCTARCRDHRQLNRQFGPAQKTVDAQENQINNSRPGRINLDVMMTKDCQGCGQQ